MIQGFPVQRKRRIETGGDMKRKGEDIVERDGRREKERDTPTVYNTTSVPHVVRGM